MMSIACLGWGSLIWRPESLLVQRQWFADGPILPIEFTRQSNDGRLTLVLSKNAKPVRALWAMMATDNLDVARDSLRVREGILTKDFSKSIGSIVSTDKVDEKTDLLIQQWAKSSGLDAVIWTNLRSKFNGKDDTEPTIDQAIEYLASLDANARATAEEYVRRAPKQIDTEFRRGFERAFGWTCIG